MTLQVGSLLNKRYRISGVLGQGSAGAVYLATDESQGVPCAVKENLSLSSEADRLFQREATLLAGLRHHCLPRVTNHFILANQQYLVMDYIEGEDLRQRLLREGPLPERVVVGWAVQLCDTLTYLHTRNPPVVHRDIKPAHIKLTPAGDMVLVDFGMARPASSDPKTATVTPGFTPPEQSGLGQTDGRADEYALAATLYNLLTGQTPADSVARRQGTAKLIPPQSLRPDMSPSLAAALTRALEIKAEDRFPSAADFKAALLGGTSAPAAPALARPEPPATWKPGTPGMIAPAARPRAASAPPRAAAPARRRLWPWLVGVGCVVLVLGGLTLLGGGALGYLLLRPTATLTQTQTPRVSETVGVSPASSTPAPVASATPAASETPGVSSTTPATAAASAATASDTPIPAPTTVPAGTPIGSGGRIAFLSNRDGALFQIYTMNPDGSDVQQVTHDNATKWDPNWPFNGTQLAWSADGKQLIYVAENADGQGTDLFMINADGSDRVNLTNHAGDDFQPDWCSDGSIWFASTRVSNGVQQIFHTDLASIGKGLSPVNFSGTHNFPREYDPALYAGCQRALFVTTLDGPPEIWKYWLDCTACYGVVRSAKNQGGKLEEPALSADNVYLAYTLELGEAHDIVIGKLADHTVAEPVTSTQNNSEAQWSPDGQWLVFVSSRDGNREIYTMTLAGTSQTNITNNAATDTDPVWQPAQ